MTFFYCLNDFFPIVLAQTNGLSKAHFIKVQLHRTMHFFHHLLLFIIDYVCLIQYKTRTNMSALFINHAIGFLPSFLWKKPLLAASCHRVQECTFCTFLLYIGCCPFPNQETSCSCCHCHCHCHCRCISLDRSVVYTSRWVQGGIFVTGEVSWSLLEYFINSTLSRLFSNMSFPYNFFWPES